MAKKGGGGAGCGVVALIALGAIAAVPKEAWVGLGIVAVIGVVIYLWATSGNSSSSASRESDSTTPSLTVRVETGRSSRYSGAAASAISRSVTPESCWKVPGTAVKVAGYELVDGALYVGEGLGDVVGEDIEPALINTKLTVDGAAGQFEPLGYWPSYSRITSRARGRYLNWLAEGRKDPSIELGYVFLFFYGLERRILADNPADGHIERELPWVRVEIKRLLSIYGGASGSFRWYASRFLEFLSLAEISGDVGAIDRAAPEPGDDRRMSLPLQVGLGRIVGGWKPIRADWAYSWLMSDERVRLRTPAQRCRAQFKELFMLQYRETYGEGLKVSPPKSKFKAVYKPASASFGHRMISFKFDEIPDITVAEAPIRRLGELAEQVTEQLAPYSRFIARDPAGATSIQGLILLPPALWPDEHVTKLGKWLSEIKADKAAQAIDFGELIRHFPAWEDVNKEKMGAFSMALESLGVGIEPDVRWGGPMPEAGDPVVLFPLEKNERTFAATTMYRAAALTLRLAAVVSASDGGASVEEEAHLESQIRLWPDLSALERKRLGAFLKWLLLAKPSLTGMKRQTKDLDELQKRGLASFLIHVAQAEGGVSPKELKSLGKIYKLLGLNEDDLYSHAHAAATEPVIVRPSSSTEKPYAIPPKPAAATAPAAGALDMKRIEELKKESEQVSRLLAGIFADSGQEVVAADSVQAEETSPAAPSGPFRNLDAEHSGFAQLLIGRSQWTRAELQDLAEDRGFMLDGALEKINEAVLDQFNEPLLEGDDPIDINPNVLKELETA